MGDRVKFLSHVELLGATFLIACGAISLTTEPHNPDDKTGTLLLVLGLCWLGLNKAGEWWATDRKTEEPVAVETTREQAMLPPPPRPQPRPTSTYRRSEPTLTRYQIDD